MQSVAIAELKAFLSETLARVKGGEEVVVTEHERPIARIIPLWASTPAAMTEHLARSGVLRAPERTVDETFWALPRPSDSRSVLRRSLAVERREAR
jgi:prevent-host-death family protein